jgi:hypothetical protein
VLSEVVVGRPARSERSLPTNIPAFVSEISEAGFFLRSEAEYSFDDIFEILKANEF